MQVEAPCVLGSEDSSIYVKTPLQAPLGGRWVPGRSSAHHLNSRCSALPSLLQAIVSQLVLVCDLSGITLAHAAMLISCASCDGAVGIIHFKPGRSASI